MVDTGQQRLRGSKDITSLNLRSESRTCPPILTAMDVFGWDAVMSAGHECDEMNATEERPVASGVGRGQHRRATPRALSSPWCFIASRWEIRPCERTRRIARECGDAGIRWANTARGENEKADPWHLVISGRLVGPN